MALQDRGDGVFGEPGLVHGRAAHQLRAVHGRAPGAREGGRDDDFASPGRPEGRRELGPDRASQCRIYLFVDDAGVAHRVPGLHDSLRRETGRQRSGVRIDRHRVQVFSWGDLDPAEGYRGLVAERANCTPNLRRRSGRRR